VRLTFQYSSEFSLKKAAKVDDSEDDEAEDGFLKVKIKTKEEEVCRW